MKSYILSKPKDQEYIVYKRTPHFVQFSQTSLHQLGEYLSFILQLVSYSTNCVKSFTFAQTIQTTPKQHFSVLLRPIVCLLMFFLMRQSAQFYQRHFLPTYEQYNQCCET